MPDVEFLSGAADFLERAAEHLDAEPLLTTVISTAAVKEAARPSEPHPEFTRWWAVVRDGDEVRGVAMRQADWTPYPIYVGPMGEEAAAALAETPLDDVPATRRVEGALPAARVVADRLADAADAQVRAEVHLRLFEVTHLVEPRVPDGAWRPASADDVALVGQWFEAFHADSEEQGGRDPSADHPTVSEEELLARIEDSRIGFWVVDGEPVSLTGFNAPANGTVRVGPVYTPRRHRGKGYAAASVAFVSRRLLDAGLRPILFTDQANPTSNELYQRLGYRAVADMVRLGIH